MQTPRQMIAAIDKEINALRKMPRSHDYYEQECYLFAQRGRLQILRDTPQIKPIRTLRAKCPTCHRSL
jgi:hypothetical protein